jgi:hypothetical protein
MGLDTYILDPYGNQIWYFRKNPDFHNWVASKGGYNSLNFNGQTIEISCQDIQELEKILLNKSLPKCEKVGPFFGETEEFDYELMSEFIKVSLKFFSNNPQKGLHIFSSF